MLAALRPSAALPRVLRAAAPPAPLVQRRFAQAASADGPVCYIEELSGEDAGIRLLTFNRPAAKNALSRRMLDEFAESLARIRVDDGARVLVLRSLVSGVFCAGADLKERATMQQSDVALFVSKLRETFMALEVCPIPTVCAIDGAALGGGLEIALSCDLRVAGQGAKLGLPETRLAIIPGAGGTQRLPRLIGRSKAKELIFTGRQLNNVEAKEYGLVNYADANGFDRALELARQILPAGPIAIKAAKVAIDRGSQVDIATGMAIEEASYAKVIPTEDRLEGLKAFAEKRKPVYKGR
ncbi:hypothetical protein DFJ74DRAFT_641808 [Hyaloraphidium curvatum]|nr:hypothetical protein DFJ74DRAFT_641808 [Hyaloraphidium curvatum]